MEGQIWAAKYGSKEFGQEGRVCAAVHRPSWKNRRGWKSVCSFVASSTVESVRKYCFWRSLAWNSHTQHRVP